MTPPVPLAPSRAAYLRYHIVAAILALPLVVFILWLRDWMDWVWLAPPVLLVLMMAYAGKGLDHAMAQVWHLDQTNLTGPDGTQVALSDIASVGGLGATVVVVTHDFSAHRLMHQADARATRAAIQAGMDAAAPGTRTPAPRPQTGEEPT